MEWSRFSLLMSPFFLDITGQNLCYFLQARIQQIVIMWVPIISNRCLSLITGSYRQVCTLSRFVPEISELTVTWKENLIKASFTRSTLSPRMHYKSSNPVVSTLTLTNRVSSRMKMAFRGPSRSVWEMKRENPNAALLSAVGLRKLSLLVSGVKLQLTWLREPLWSSTVSVTLWRNGHGSSESKSPLITMM